MRAVSDFFFRGIQRINAKIAMLVVVTAVGGVAVWQGYSHMANSKAKTQEPTKELATGVKPAANPTPVAAAPAESGTHALLAYGQPDNPAAPPTASPPATSPGGYLPTTSDAGGYGGSFGATSAPPATSPPADPAAAAPAEPIPPNQYRPGGAGSVSDQGTGYAPQPQATAVDAGGFNPNAPAQNPVAETGASSRRGGGGYGALSDAAPAQLPAEAPAATQLQQPAAAPAETYTQPAMLPPTQAPANSLPQNLQQTPAASGFGRGDLTPAATGKLAAPTPGERQLEGPQQPAIALQKVSPAEIQVGKPATFELYIRNTGAIPAHQVVVTDHVPAGTQLIDARPQPQQGEGGALVWTFPALQPNEETQITLQVMPQAEGEIGSTAHVTFAAAATSRSICTRPQLTIEHAAPPKVLIGESFQVEITISNPGSGPATGVRIEEDVPAGLAHAAGAQLEYEVGTLRPGESKRLSLVLTAKQAGVVQNVIHVKGDANLAAQHAVQVEIVAPQLTVDVDGPKRRPLERQATYTLQIANPGTASARNVELVAFLPRGMKFVATDAQGQYDATQHAVFWSLEELPPAKAGAVKLTALPIEPGEQRLRVEGRAGLGLNAADEQIVQVEQSAELVLSVKDIDEVIEVGSETTYEVRIVNSGTKAATNVRVAAQLPAELAAINGEGPTRATGDATQIVFEPLARLNPREEVVYKVHVQGKQAGDHIVRVQLSSDEWPTPVTREESTRVYLDR